MNMVYLFAFSLLKILLNIIPDSLRESFVKFMGKSAYSLNKKHRKIALINLDLAFGDTKTKEEKEQIVKQMYENFSFFAYDFIKNQNTTQEEVLQKVDFANKHIMQQALQSKRPLIIQTAHYGNWELLALAFGVGFGDISIVGRKLDSKVMNRILSKNRTQFNIELIDKKRAAKSMLKALKTGRILGVLVDQNTTVNEGIEVSFFGKRVMHTNALGIIAKKTDALIIPVFIVKNEANRHTITFYKPLDIRDNTVEEITQLQADITQQVIEQKPDEYFWFHKRFKHFYRDKYGLNS